MFSPPALGCDYATGRFYPTAHKVVGYFLHHGGSVKPTENDLIAAYEYLYSVKPFSGWNLPPSKSITFEVNKSQQLQGEYDTDPHTIRASSFFCKTQNDVIETVAHEMVHLHMERAGQFSHANHGRDFRAHARKVCAQFGWKVKDF